MILRGVRPSFPPSRPLEGNEVRGSSQRYAEIVPRVVAAALVVLGAAGLATASNDGLFETTPEGFSESVHGLPEAVLSAWSATVLIEGAAVIKPESPEPTLRTNRGSGLVVRVADRRGQAVVITNAHVVECGPVPCELRVGFSRGSHRDHHVWSGEARITSVDTRRDLAFLTVEVPPGAGIEEPRFATPSCVDTGDRAVVSIGWPDLTKRRTWGVDPPENHIDHVKRYSSGLFLSEVSGYRPLSRTRGRLERMGVVFHNADVLPGSSGGPVVSRTGEVLGINTHVVSNTRNSHLRYCARRDVHDMENDCVHLAISSAEIADYFKKTFRGRMDVAECDPPRRQTARTRVAAADSDRTATSVP
jgi:S1-C subfamily serine protease